MAGQPWDGHWKSEGKRLGKGGQGITELVASIDGSTAGALKILKNNRSEQARLRMRGEVVNLEVLAPLGANVPRVLEHNTSQFADPNTQLYVVTEFIQGETLEEFVERSGRLDLDTAASIVLALADTMRIAHTRPPQPVLHRDLKPANVMVRDASRPDIVTIDYGLSFNHEQQDVTATSDSFRNEFLDLPEYRTPGANKRDPRSDVTMLSGILCWAMTASVPGPLQGPDGRLPHMRPGSEVQQLLTGDPRAAALEVFFNKGFAQNVESRFQNVDEFVERLNLVLRSTSGPTHVEPAVAVMRERERLSKGDRKTQIAAYLRALQPLTQQFQQFVNSQGQGKFEPFHVSAQTAFPNVPPPRDRFEQLQNIYGARLIVDNHDIARICIFAVGIRGQQGALLLKKLKGTGSAIMGGAPLRITSTEGDWEHLCWFDGGSAPGFEVLKEAYEKWFDEASREITDEAIARGSL